ncbi:MAG: hypothetical protein LCH98_05405 [Actinobacteria bacterium]|nr:hypothetical protein [Actinomycetota bacterium]
MADEIWQHARLFPTTGIPDVQEQDRRAAAALLAVMAGVREFGRFITDQAGAPRGTLEAFVGVPFTLGKKRVVADGLLRVTRGGTTWTALVEVKTGPQCLRPEDLERRLDLAREQGFNAVLSLSNEVSSSPGLHPTRIDRAKVRNVGLYHLAWSQVIAEAVRQKQRRGATDPDQGWILGELVHYLVDPVSGGLDFSDMGASWDAVRKATKAGAIRSTDKGLRDVVGRWDGLLRCTALQLGRTSGQDVNHALSRREISDPSSRTEFLVNQAVARGTLTGSIAIASFGGPIDVTVDLRGDLVTCAVDIAAPAAGRPATWVKGLLRQLAEAPETVCVQARGRHDDAGGTAQSLQDLRVKPDGLLADLAMDLRGVTVSMAAPMGPKPGLGRGSFIRSVEDTVNVFYRDVIRHLTAAPTHADPEESAPRTAASPRSAVAQDAAAG